MINLKHLFTILSTGLILAGMNACNLAPVFDKPATDKYDNFKYAAFADSLSSVPLDSVWWKYFEDPTLNDIIEEVSLNNNNLKAELHSFEQISELARVDRSVLLPEVEIGLGSSRRLVSENVAQRFQTNNFSSYTISALISYQLDLWGQLRNNYKASVIEAEISLLEYYNLLTVLRAQAASTYMNIRRLDAQIALYDSTIILRERSVEIAKLNFEAGASDALDLTRAETQLRIAQSQRWTFVNQRARLENGLAVLMGREPSSFSLPENPIENLPPIIPSEVPSTILTRRPDIWAALKTMEMENLRIGVARANFFPSITLSADGGYQGRSFETLVSPESFAWTIGAGLVQPIFNYGRNEAIMEAARARYEQVTDLYQQSVLSAFEEVENELATIYFLHQQHERQQQTVAAATRTYDLARQRYQAGYVSYLEVVDAERTALLNQVDAVMIVYQLYESMINLSLASGGNWNAGPQIYVH